MFSHSENSLDSDTDSDTDSDFDTETNSMDQSGKYIKSGNVSVYSGSGEAIAKKTIIGNSYQTFNFSSSSDKKKANNSPKVKNHSENQEGHNVYVRYGMAIGKSTVGGTQTVTTLFNGQKTTTIIEPGKQKSEFTAKKDYEKQEKFNVRVDYGMAIGRSIVHGKQETIIVNNPKQNSHLNAEPKKPFPSFFDNNNEKEKIILDSQTPKPKGSCFC